MQTSLIACRAQAAERLFGDVADVFNPVGRFRVGDPAKAAEPARRRTRTEHRRDEIDPAKCADGQELVLSVVSR
jgi:hypothetical protein